ncbi:Fur family transcriptional regulator [Yinghuangia sp. YIM S09857]|uniref:Fur family transcriptional regulator n=1 Tax=Yinghuangia sp. YIM S09857 TaxID=3436929 RepID=UPI003F52A4F7
MSTDHDHRPRDAAFAVPPDALRATHRRRRVLQALESQREFVSAQELFTWMRSQGWRISLSTTYRNLALLERNGTADTRLTPGGERQFRRRRRDDHHHLLICRHCGTAVEVHSPALERWAATVGRPHGFTDVDHAVELTGTCRTCRVANPPDRPGPPH